MTKFLGFAIFLILFIEAFPAAIDDHEKNNNCPFNELSQCDDECRADGSFGGKCQEEQCKCHNQCDKYRMVHNDDTPVGAICNKWCIEIKEKHKGYCSLETQKCICLEIFQL